MATDLMSLDEIEQLARAVREVYRKELEGPEARLADAALRCVGALREMATELPKALIAALMLARGQ